MHKSLLWLSLTLGIALFGCEKEEPHVPNIATNISINLNLPSYNALQNPGGWLYLTGGSEGIIVYRLTDQDFVALDRHCPFNVVDHCRVSVDEETNVTAVDYECCGSVFSILDGMVQAGEARRPLKKFNTLYNANTKELKIYN